MIRLAPIFVFVGAKKVHMPSVGSHYAPYHATQHARRRIAQQIQPTPRFRTGNIPPPRPVWRHVIDGHTDPLGATSGLEHDSVGTGLVAAPEAPDGEGRDECVEWPLGPDDRLRCLKHVPA